jgi:hypothetical protein
MMKKFVTVAITLVMGMLLGAVLLGGALAAGPAPWATPNASPTPGTGYGYGPGQMGRGYMWGGELGFEEEVLSFLGMTREQVIAERQAGKSLAQIAQEKGKTVQQLIDTILAAKRADLNDLVSQGKLTQAQADAMYQNMQQVVVQAVNRTTIGPMWGNGTRPMDPDDCPMFGGQPGQGQPGNGQITPQFRGRGGMMGGWRSGPST